MYYKLCAIGIVDIIVGYLLINVYSLTFLLLTEVRNFVALIILIQLVLFKYTESLYAFLNIVLYTIYIISLYCNILSIK